MMASTIKLSIIIPVYNGSDYIENCLDSVYKQKLGIGLFEVIVINDGSTDDTKNKVLTYADAVANLILVNKDNGGVSSARNMGIESANGEFVLFLDADDELVEGSLIRVYEYLSNHKDIDMLVTRQSRFNGHTERIVNNVQNLAEHVEYTGVETYQKGYVRGNAGGAICRTEFLRENGLSFPLGIKNGEDTILFGLVHVFAKKIIYLNELLYRINEISVSATRTNFGKKCGNMAETLNKAIEIRNNLVCTPSQQGVMEHVVYRILSSLTACSVRSYEYSYNQLRKVVDLSQLLPFDTRYMYIMRNKARLINFSYPLFYLLSYLDNSIFRNKNMVL